MALPVINLGSEKKPQKYFHLSPFSLPLPTFIFLSQFCHATGGPFFYKLLVEDFGNELGKKFPFHTKILYFSFFPMLSLLVVVFEKQYLVDSFTELYLISGKLFSIFFSLLYSKLFSVNRKKFHMQNQRTVVLRNKLKMFVPEGHSGTFGMAL